MNKKNKLIKRIALGRVTAAVFLNQGSKGEYLVCRLDKWYRKKDGDFGHTNSFAKEELPSVLSVVQDALKYIEQQEVDTDGR